MLDEGELLRNECRPDFSSVFPRLSVCPGSGEAEGVLLSALSTGSHPLMAELFAGVRRHYPALPVKGQAALGMMRLAYFLGLAAAAGAAGLVPMLRAIPALTLDGDDFRFSGEGPGIDPEAALAGPVAGFAQASRLARRALWRVAADGIAAAHLALGRHQGDEAGAATRALTLLKREGSPFYNRQLALEPIDTPSGPRILRRAGGCCRLSESPGHPLCPGCVLQSRPEQDRAIRELWD